MKALFVFAMAFALISSVAVAAECGDADHPCAKPAPVAPIAKTSTPGVATAPANNEPAAATKPSKPAKAEKTEKAKPAPVPADSSLSATPVIGRSGKANYCKLDETSHTDTDGNVYCTNRGDHGKHHGSGGINSKPIILPTAGRVIYPAGTPYVDGYGNIIYCPGLLIIDTTGTGPNISCDIPQPPAPQPVVVAPATPPVLPTGLKSDRNLRSDRNL